MVEWGSPKFLVRFINHCFYSYFFKLFFGKITFRVQIYDVGGSTCFFFVSSKTLWSIVNDITPTTIWSSVHLTSSPAHLNLPQSSAHSRSRPSYRHLSDLLASSRNPSPQVHLSLSQSRVYSCPSQAKPHLKSQSSFAGRLVKQMHGWSTYPLVVGQTQCTYQLIHLYCKVLQRPRGKDWRSPKGFQPSATSHLELRPCSHRSNPYHYHRRLDNVLSYSEPDIHDRHSLVSQHLVNSSGGGSRVGSSRASSRSSHAHSQVSSLSWSSGIQEI